MRGTDFALITVARGDNHRRFLGGFDSSFKAFEDIWISLIAGGLGCAIVCDRRECQAKVLRALIIILSVVRKGRVKDDGKLSGGGGDGIVIKREFEDGSFGDAIVVDTGCTKAGAAKILDKIKEQKKGIRDIRLVITHQDADHIGGLAHILDEAAERGVRVREILVGKLPHDEDLVAKRKTELWKELSIRLDRDDRYERGNANSSTVAHWVMEGSDSVVETVDDPIQDLKTIRLKTLDDVQIDISQILSPTTTNQTSLVTNICFRGLRHVLTADGDEAVLSKLSSSSSTRSSGIMKWPHHLWNAKKSKAIKDLLSKYRPHTIILSNRASQHPEDSNLTAIEAIVEEVLGKDKTNILYTGHDGDIHVIVKNQENVRQLIALLGRGMASETDG